MRFPMGWPNQFGLSSLPLHLMLSQTDFIKKYHEQPPKIALTQYYIGAILDDCPISSCF